MACLLIITAHTRIVVQRGSTVDPLYEGFFSSLLEAAVRAVPSPSEPSPGSDPYFDGGYSTSRHTTTLPGLQIESHFPGVRDTATSRAAFGHALATAVVTFLQRHGGL